MSDSDELPRISLLRNGPLVLGDHGLGACLCRDDGTAYEVHGAAVLCRCGGSARKPFCDGTHASIGFSDERVSDRRHDHRDDYAGAGITVHDNRHACAHSERCIHGAPEAFHKMHRPWITPDAVDPDHLAEVVSRCPSGALSHTRDGVERRDFERAPRVVVLPGGPYEVTGGVGLAVGEDEWAVEVSREHYTLCRCGGSSNKPFCDGTHWKNGFAEAGE